VPLCSRPNRVGFQNYCNLDEYRTLSELSDIGAYLSFVETKLAPLSVSVLCPSFLALIDGHDEYCYPSVSNHTM
jgi:hypothetical protein